MAASATASSGGPPNAGVSYCGAPCSAPKCDCTCALDQDHDQPSYHLCSRCLVLEGLHCDIDGDGTSDTKSESNIVCGELPFVDEPSGGGVQADAITRQATSMPTLGLHTNNARPAGIVEVVSVWRTGVIVGAWTWSDRDQIGALVQEVKKLYYPSFENAYLGLKLSIVKDDGTIGRIHLSPDELLADIAVEAGQLDGDELKLKLAFIGCSCFASTVIDV